MPDFVKGLSNSLEKSSPELISQIKQLSNEMSNAMQPKMGLNGLDLNETSLNSINSQTNFDLLLEAFKTALSDMKVEMNGEEMGKFVDKTVSEAIFT